MIYKISSLLLLSAAAFAEQVAEQVSTTSFDLYLLAQSWQPEFCYGTSYPGCSHPEEYWKTHFTIHGLWPQYASSGYPQSCTNEPFDESIPDEIGWDTMTTYWPNVKYDETSSDYTEFWEHEWSKHGTCSNLSQYDYFSSAISLLQKFGTPSVVSDNVGGSVSKSSLQAGFGGSKYVSLQCQGGQYLSEARTCWSKDSNNFPVAQIECPSSVLSQDTCSKSTIIIEAF